VADLRKNFDSTYFITPPTRPGTSARPRIVPQQRDEIAFNAVLNWSDPSLRLDAASLGLTEPTNVLAAYNYFKRVLRYTGERADRDDVLSSFADLFPLDVDLVQTIAASRLLFVEVLTTSVDDANAIFESLNFKVVPLTAVDLLKNYLFMLLRSDEDRLLQEWWNPVVRRLGGESELTDFVLADMVSRGQATSRNRLYESKQSELRGIRAASGTDGLWGELTRLRANIRAYQEARWPLAHGSGAVRAAIAAIHDARGATAVPLIMYVLREARAEGVPELDLVAALRLIESYLVRRFICGEDSHNLNSYFSSMLSRAYGRDAARYRELDLVPRVAAILDSSLSGRDWPDDARVREAVVTQDFYNRGEPSQRILVFRRLDTDCGQRLTIDYAESNLEVEHIFPQTGDVAGEWAAVAADAGMSLSEFQQRYLHSLANLVPLLRNENLTASNHPFAEKLPVYRESSLKITQQIFEEFGEHGVWGQAEILARGEDLANRVVRIWPKPEAHVVAEAPTAQDIEIEEEEEISELVVDTLADEVAEEDGLA
jgi:hypothetical protein